MCGILGSSSPDSFTQVNSHLHYLDRRGPDSRNVIELDRSLTFGATRLAMTDPLPRSNQPMVSKQSGSAIIFNGEIYNYLDLKNELIGQGIDFNTTSDTEVLLKAIDHFGSEIIPRLEGMFAFVFYDKSKNNLIMARDYLGKKPLYYAIRQSNLHFSSQLKLVKKLSKLDSINQAAVSEYLSLGYIIDPYTIYENIFSVQPGEIITFNLSDVSNFRKKQFIPQLISQPNIESIQKNIQDSIIKRVQGHDRFAISYSGGIDSTIIALECAKLGLNVDLYSMHWSESNKQKYNEDFGHASKVSKELGFKLNPVDMISVRKIPEILNNFNLAMEEPNSNPTGLSMTHLYSVIAGQDHRIVLTGDGADEIFGGYKRYELALKTDFFPSLNMNYLKSLIEEKAPGMRFMAKILLAFSHHNSDQYWLFWHILAGKNSIRKIAPDLPLLTPKIKGLELCKHFTLTSTSGMLFRDLKTWLTMESNRKLDRISMWNSIEARSPFQSESVIGSGYKKMEQNEFRLIRKELLLQAYPQLNSISVRRQKSGFISPLGFWLRNNQQLIENMLSSLPNYMQINKSKLNLLSKSPSQKDFSNIKILWSLIVLNSWFELNN